MTENKWGFRREKNGISSENEISDRNCYFRQLTFIDGLNYICGGNDNENKA